MEIHPQHWGSVRKISMGGVAIDPLKIYTVEIDADKNSPFIHIYGKTAMKMRFISILIQLTVINKL